jgi:hypothetical protein
MTDDARSFWALSLITMGGLITALCGSCTAYFVGNAVLALIHGGYDAGFAPFVLVIAAVLGGVPTLLGVLLLIEGFRQRRRKG